MSDTLAAMRDQTPDQALAHAERLLLAGRPDEARLACAAVLAALPDHPPALALQGVIAGRAGDAGRAVDYLEAALRRQPGVASWHAHLVTFYRALGRAADAVAAGSEAMRLAPADSGNLVKLSLAFAELGDHDSAITCQLRAIGLDPARADAHLALAEGLLAAGEFGPGWIEYEWRNETEAGRGLLPTMTSARWNGMRIPKGRILLVGDQGYGDTIQFARYIELVAQRCESVFLGCSAELAPLLARLPGVAACFQNWDAIPGHAAHARLSSLPGLFHTTIDTIPDRTPYLQPDPARVAAWAQHLERAAPRPLRRIGLAWSGRPTHPNDHRRSLRLARLAPLGSVAGTHFVSLQKPFPPPDAAAAGAFPGLGDLSAQLADFADTAALIANLDLVVTVDSAVAHLSGALGVPVWILLPWASDWRWLRGRADSPWYPTARLFRQRNAGAWDEVVAGVAAALRALPG
ncbi:MAG: glycosyltransferase family protein [Rhodospirillales bacterium]|nr:glycosyltransferase family protein [Rhodospirillales bacterium]